MKQVQTRKKALMADISLVVVAAFWGANYFIAKEALDAIHPFTYLALRFTLAGLLVAAVYWKKFLKITLKDVIAGSVVGLFLFLIFAFQITGLIYTTPSKSGFIIGMSVVFVPLLCFLLFRINPGWQTFTGGVLALLGLFLLSATETFRLEYGDLLTFIAAVFAAAHTIALAIFAPRHNPIILSIAQLLFTGIASLVIALFIEPISGMFSHSLQIWGAIWYAVIICSVVGFITLTVAQRFTSPNHVALILTTEVIFAGLFSYLFWGEILTVRMLLGAFLILCGILITELRPIMVAKKGGDITIYDTQFIERSESMLARIKILR